MNECVQEMGMTNQPPDHTVRVQQLFVKEQTAIRAFICSLQPDFSEADDVLQETFLTVTRKAAEFIEGSNFTAWAFAIARFKVLESRRRRASGNLELSETVLDALVAAAPNSAFFDVRLAALRHCLDQLAPRAQEIVRLRYHSARGSQEIARHLDWSRNAVDVALSRARNTLRECVQRAVRRIV